MPRKLRQLKADMRRAGARLVSEEGDHEKWRHPLVQDLLVELAGKDGSDAKPYQEKQVRSFLKRIAEAKRGYQP